MTKGKSWMIHFVSLKDFLTDFECAVCTRDGVKLTIKWHIQDYSIVPIFKRDMKIYIKVANLDKVLVRQTDEPKDLKEWLELCTNYIKRNYKTKLDGEDIEEREIVCV